MIYTGSYQNCKSNKFRLVSISKDNGQNANFNGECYSKLAPKQDFWNIWHGNIGKVSEENNNRYYIEEYYKQVLSKLDPKQVYRELEGSILLCYEETDFCHRNIVAAWLELTLGIQVPEVIIKNGQLVKQNRPFYYKEELEKIMEKYEKLKIKFIYQGQAYETLEILEKNGFYPQKYEKISHTDFYYDTDDYQYLLQNKFLKIRQDDRLITGIYGKMIPNEGEIIETERVETSSTFRLTIEDFKQYLSNLEIQVPKDLYRVLKAQSDDTVFTLSDGTNKLLVTIQNIYYINGISARIGNEVILELMGNEQVLKKAYYLLQHNPTLQLDKSTNYNTGSKKASINPMMRIRKFLQ